MKHNRDMHNTLSLFVNKNELKIAACNARLLFDTDGLLNTQLNVIFLRYYQATSS